MTFVDFGGFEDRFVLAGLCQMFFKLHYLALILLSAVLLELTFAMTLGFRSQCALLVSYFLLIPFGIKVFVAQKNVFEKRQLKVKTNSFHESSNFFTFPDLQFYKIVL